MLLNEILWLIKHFKMNSDLVQIFSNSGYLCITDGCTRIDISEQFMNDALIRFMWVYKVLENGKFTKMFSTTYDEYVNSMKLVKEKEG